MEKLKEEEDKRSIEKRLRLKGVIVTDKGQPTKRLLVDELGNKLGYFRPLEALKEFNA